MQGVTHFNEWNLCPGDLMDNLRSFLLGVAASPEATAASRH